MERGTSVLDIHEDLAISSSSSALACAPNHLFPKGTEKRRGKFTFSETRKQSKPSGSGVTAIWAKSRKKAENGLGQCTVLEKFGEAHITKGQTRNH